jgi:amidase
MGTAWSEASLLKWASSIEDLQRTTKGALKRTLPQWYGYLERNIPVRNL